MTYSEELAEELLSDAETLNSELSLRFVRLGSAVSTLKVPRAREYLLHGVCRRVDTLRRCMIGVFHTFPVDQKAPLEDEERFLVEVYLQAFLINLFGVFDNVAWTLLFENGITFEEKNQKGMRRRDVGLFLAATQAHLEPKLRKLLSSLDNWHSNYVKPYRDALAHRLPLYVPPFGLREHEQQASEDLMQQMLSALATGDTERFESVEAEYNRLGVAMPAFAQGPSAEGDSRPMMLHPQLIVDLKTTIVILDSAFLANA